MAMRRARRIGTQSYTTALAMVVESKRQQRSLVTARTTARKRPAGEFSDSRTRPSNETEL